MPAVKAPALTITAVGSGRKIILNKIGTPAVLIFHGRSSVEASRAVNTPVRDLIPEATRLLVITVMDLKGTPRLARGLVEAFIRDAYEEACKQLPKGWNPWDYLILLPDWDGQISKGFGLKDVGRNAGVAVLDGEGNIVGVYQGKDLAAQTLRMIEDQL